MELGRGQTGEGLTVRDWWREGFFARSAKSTMSASVLEPTDSEQCPSSSPEVRTQHRDP